MTPPPTAPVLQTQTLTRADTRTDASLMQTAKELEMVFLSEMLSFSGLGSVSSEFGGGVGETQFASFLRAEQARLMVDRGGIGLAGAIFESLKSMEVAGDDKP